MVRENKLKSGFSLVEVLIAMLLMSLFFLASTKIITMKPPQEVQEKPHGYYECFGPLSDHEGLYLEHKSVGDAYVVPTYSQGCSFDPPGGIPFANLYYIDNYENYYLNIQEPQFNQGLDSVPNTPFENGPQGILTIYQDYDKMRTDFNNGGPRMFKTYLENVHPSCEILKRWVDDSTDTKNGGRFSLLYGLFIAW